MELDPLKLCHTSNKITMLYNFVGGLFDTNPREGTLDFTPNPAHETKLLVPNSKIETHKNSFFPSAIRLWNTIPPHAPAADSPLAFRPPLRPGWGMSNTLKPHCLFSACFPVTVPAFSLLNFCLCVLSVTVCCPKLLGFPQHNE